jgi:hypothetical protein
VTFELDYGVGGAPGPLLNAVSQDVKCESKPLGSDPGPHRPAPTSQYDLYARMTGKLVAYNGTMEGELVDRWRHGQESYALGPNEIENIVYDIDLGAIVMPCQYLSFQATPFAFRHREFIKQWDDWQFFWHANLGLAVPWKGI